MIVGADTGGTFTDLAAWSGARLRTLKVASTPGDFSDGVIDGIERVCRPDEADLDRPVELVHATTVATNALLERKGAKVALVTTRGFRDLLVIGRQNRPSLYDLAARPVAPLVPPERCFELNERIAADGSVLVALGSSEIERVLGRIDEAGADSVAVCLLFAFLRPQHERRFGEMARARGYEVSLSSDIAPEFREYERASTTVANAYVGPILRRYLERVVERSSRIVDDVRIVQSNGASLHPRSAGEQAIRSALSGPAAGVVGARSAAVDVLGEKPRAISFDMGGTSTDVALIDGQPSYAGATEVAGHPLQIPVVDVHTVGAGGGSIARVDRGGALRVGPRSAGAEPGPACYGKGGPATVSDADLVLGWLRADHFLGGRVALDVEAAERAVAGIADAIGSTLEDAAHGIARIVTANMERSVRLISIERGHDPGDFWLIAFGGAGGLHACDLAGALAVRGVVVPRDPGVLSAIGAATSDVAVEVARTIMLGLDDEAVAEQFARIEAAAREEAASSGGSAARVERSADVRYCGQSHELTIPWSDDCGAFASSFHREHELRFGFHAPEEPIEVVTLRVRLVRPSEAPRPAPIVGGVTVSEATLEVCSAGPVIDRLALAAGASFGGPSLLVEPYATTRIPEAWRATVTEHGHLVLEPGA